MKSFIKWMILSIVLATMFNSCSNIYEQEAGSEGCKLVECYKNLKAEVDPSSTELWFLYTASKSSIEIAHNAFTIEEIKGFVKEDCGDEAAEFFIEAMNCTEYDVQKK
ncbi:MAG: hypothetical protein ACI9N1_002659 [Flavobacteriales bacterium]|jgi:hypothetical protein